jgi:threonine/homoserine/homoserine lactone efflux protein
MPLRFFIEGVIIGFVVAVPVGPLGLLCINRALSTGPVYGLSSGLGVATADAIAAGIAVLGLTLVSGFLIDHQLWLRLIGGIFLCYLGFKIYITAPVEQPPVNDVNGLLGAYATTFFLTFSNPLTILSFVAIYAGWGVESLSGNYFLAGVLMIGVFAGSSLWWVVLTVGLAAFRDRFSTRILRWIHRVSGTVIAGFGAVILLSLLQMNLEIHP